MSTTGRPIETLGLEYDASVDAFTGQASLRVAVPAPPGRGGFGPRLALVHRGGVNSTFGVGWSLAGLSTISVDTRRRLPRYDGSDAVQLDGLELVPWLTSDGQAAREHVSGRYRVAFFRARRGVATVRIERWTDTLSGDVHYRTRDAANVATIYGARASNRAVISDGCGSIASA